MKSLLTRFKKKVLSNWTLYLFVLPMVLYYVVFHYRPLYGVQIAFQDYRIGEIFGQSEWVGLKHFIRFFESAWFETLLTNTLTLSILQVLVTFPLPIVLALLLNEVRRKSLRYTVQTVSYAPHFISVVILCGMLDIFLSPNVGIIGMTVNNIRESMGLNPINIMADGKNFKWVYVLSDVWQSTGWASIIYLSALSGVDLQLLEAAEIDGANKFQRIMKINLPVLVPTIMIQLILRCGSLLSVGFEKVFLLQNDQIIMDSEVISTYVYRVGMTGMNYSFSTAVNLFNSVVNAVILLLVNGITKKVNSENSLF